jgi:hypothetical protein
MRALVADDECGKYAVWFTERARGVSASIYRRDHKSSRELPMAAVRLADPRIERSCRLDEGRRLLGQPGCCQGAFWARMLSAGAQTPEQLLEPRWQRCITGWAMLISRALSIAGLERRNKRSRDVLTKSHMQLGNFTATSMLRELQANDDAARGLAVARAKADDVKSEDVGAAPKKPPRGVCAFDVWLTETFGDMALEGEQGNVVGFSEGFRSRKQLVYDALSPEQKGYYEGESIASKERAKRARKKYKRGLKAWVGASPTPLTRVVHASDLGSAARPRAGCTHCPVCGVELTEHFVKAPVSGMHGLRSEEVKCACYLHAGNDWRVS